MVLKWGERRIGLATIALCSLAAFIVPAATVQAQLSPPPPGMVVWLDPDVGLSEFQGPSSGGLGGGAGVSTRVRWLDKSPNGFIFEHSNHGEWAANSIASSVNPANKIQGHDVAFAGQNPGFVSVDNTGTATSAGNPIGSTRQTNCIFSPCKVSRKQAATARISSTAATTWPSTSSSAERVTRLRSREPPVRQIRARTSIPFTTGIMLAPIKSRRSPPLSA